MKKHLVFICVNPFGDNGHFTGEHVEQIQSVCAHISDTILQYEKEITSYVIMKAENNDLATDCVDIITKSELGTLPHKIKSVPFLKSGADEKPEKVGDVLLGELKSSPLVIVISQLAILKRLPETLLKKTNKNPNGLIRFAQSPNNFKTKRSVLIGFDEHGEIHNIHTA